MSKLEEQLNQASKAEASGGYFNAAFMYKEALSLARDLGNSAAIKECKSKIPEMNKKMKDELNHFSVEQKISEEEINKIVQHFLDIKDTDKILEAIGREPIFCPNYQTIVNSASKTMPVSYNFVNLSTISEDGHLINGGDDPVKAWQMTIYEQSQTIILRVYLTSVFYRLVEDAIINQDTLSAFFERTGFFNEHPFEIIKAGIEKFFVGDFISALHILIPQFESLFLFLSEKLGLDIVALNAGKGISTQTRTLSVTFLSTPECIKVWGEDFCQQLTFILFEPLGYKLRHKIAHGEIKASECNFGTASLALYLYFVLAARVKPVQKK